ncbi:hypothetical protein D2Q93_07405 [Alicyclobacillaceae bacterium I2511]|jgi:hypothetical protein|nr:hypothetical protein D2Q93_07405 [Alicyclobacillaceae bacterium I2511]
MLKLLVVSFDESGLNYVEQASQKGCKVRVLDCSESHHNRLESWYGTLLLHAEGHRNSVRDVVAQEGFTDALVEESEDFVYTALIIQSLREAGVRNITVVTTSSLRRGIYQRFGALRVWVVRSMREGPHKFADLLCSNTGETTEFTLATV